jgi:hypothetical protein
MITLALAPLLLACRDPQPDTIGEVLPDHTLTDVNPTSPTYGAEVSVSDTRGEVSAWYFGHAT